MPITKELENLRKFESVGFTHEQSEVLTDVIEQSHVNGQQDLKEFIRNELDLKINRLEIRILESQRDLLIKFITIVTAIVGIATAIIKLF
ncbi:MAG TPA: hypothetical protein VJ440_02555 [Candidatus Brocadiaceae bacterium]|nr:hypothetical protein [Candidatus Brocadiaceae bacterium]